MKCLVAKGGIAYEVEGSGFPLLILHSMGTDHRSMKAWLEPVFTSLEGFQRIYIDLPAHGQSLIDKTFSSSDDALMNILDFIDQIIPNQDFSLIGFSYGGYLAQGIMHKRLNNVKGICLLATALHKKDRNLPVKVVIKKEEELKELDPDLLTAFETLMTYQTKENLEYFLKEIQPGRILANRNFLASNWREKGYFLSEEPLKDTENLQHPALILTGKQDSICGYKDHLSLFEKFSNASFVVLNQAGHMLQIEKREMVQELIKDWLMSEQI
ncbi:alpha/beta fold hydrolase [Pseudoneobacillus sp. C159]